MSSFLDNTGLDFLLEKLKKNFDKKADSGTTLADYGITDAATSAQGTKADSAVQTIQINGTTQTKTNGVVNLPAYPTSLPANGGTATKATQDGSGNVITSTYATKTEVNAKYTKPSTGIPATDLASGVIPTSLPASNTTDTYSATGTAPVSGKAVASAISGLDVTGTTSFGAGKTISTWSETDGKISITSQNISITKSQVSDFPTSMPASDVSAWAKASSKPTYTASEVGALASTVTHLSGDIATSQKGTANGVATLDANGLVPSSQLPSFVDDVLEYSAKSSFPATGETGKIYVDTSKNLTYRWSGTAYVEISPSIALGETSSTAYAGDKGKANADAISALQTSVAGKQATLSAAQLNAVNSGITSSKVSTYDGYATTIASKGTYSKPSTGIPKTDLASAVQTSLGKADTALQSLNLEGLTDWESVSDATVSNITYKVYWKTTPTTSNDVYGLAFHPTTNILYYIRSNKGTLSAGAYNSNTNTQIRIYKDETSTYNLIGSRTDPGSITSGSTSVYGEISATNPITMTPSTGTITATTFSGTATNASKVNNLTVETAVPANAKFTDTTYSAGEGLSLSSNTFKSTSGVHYVKGTQTAATNVWTGALPTGVTEYYDGLTIEYFLPYAGTSTAATLNLGSKGAKPVYQGNSTSGVTTHFPANSVIHLVYVVNSALNSGNGCWKAIAYYNSNTWTANSASAAGYVASGSGQANKVWKTDANGAPAWRDDADTTYSNATTSASGLMSAADKTKLNGIATGATANTGTVTSIAVKMNNTTKGTITSSGTIDLGTVITAHQDISGKADKASITAGTAGTSSATSGASLAVPYVTVNAQGIVTGYGTHTHTISGFSTTDTKNTAGSTDTSSKIYLVGATSQAANPQTYSDNQVYATNGQLDANKIRVAEKVTFEYDSTNECLNLNFA